MISMVRGTVISAGVDRLVVDLGMVGVQVVCTPVTAAGVRHGEHVELLTTLVVREDSWTLYGFLDADERMVFEQVQTVTGIGPRIALALLGTLTPDDLRRAVASSDEVTLTAVPGIGRKGAQRILLELADRLGEPVGGPVRGAAPSATAGWQASVAAGLSSLGWSAKEADAAVASLDPELSAAADAAGADADIPGLLKAALRGLARS